MGIWGGKFRIGTQSEYVVGEVKMEDGRWKTEDGRLKIED
jgi:hypothetical protein